LAELVIPWPLPADDLGRGRPVVFLHGWSTDARFFHAQAPLADRGLRLILPDLPGHGRNRDPERPLGFPDLADALDGFLHSERLDGVVLVGWSMGAAVAFDRFRRYGSARIAGLVIVDMTPRILDAPGWPYGLTGGLRSVDVVRAAVSMRADWQGHAARIAPRLFATSRLVDDPLVEEAAARISEADGTAMADLWSSLARADFRDVLPRIAVPSLVVSGAQSRLYTPAVGAAVAAAMPRARHVVIPGTGHAPHLEAPDVFNALVEDFAANL
jgi:pimeloyl-[acyl-carrier protein] methyl ester esterase